MKKDTDIIEKLILHPLFEAYDFIKLSPDIQIFHENEITKRIYWYIRNSSSISDQIEQHLINVTYRPKEVNRVKNKYDESEPDLVFFIARNCNFAFETKRIYGKGYTEYVGDGGLGCFLTEKYSKDERNAGMIAYVQKGDFSLVQKKIAAKISESDCIELREDIGIDYVISSTHTRSSSSMHITIFHLFFDLT
ncbi:MAG TPA: hypothetical protein C5S51_06450 [Methanosarcinaceae archaeon]|nr:hypothetical protein [Methanosarcinaceae archaeon]